jgi:hypothetical protein
MKLFASAFIQEQLGLTLVAFGLSRKAHSSIRLRGIARCDPRGPFPSNLGDSLPNSIQWRLLGVTLDASKN